MNHTNKVCTICTRELIPVIDGDDVVCAQCRAEESHDFDVDPNALTHANVDIRMIEMLNLQFVLRKKR